MLNTLGLIHMIHMVRMNHTIPDQSPVAVQDQSRDPDPGRIHQGVAKTQGPGPGPGLAAGDEAAGDRKYL